MWKMFDDMIECDECGGPLGPPPKFMIPPPPRPPSLSDYSISNCNEEEMALKAQQAWDSDMCEAMPILDASLYSSQSLQTSAMIAVFSLLLVLVVLISSLFVWKNKRKVQNFLPCKTPTRGPHINGGLPLGGAHSVTYEDPDAHLGHRPLVMRHHHNVEMLHGKSIHYPSGYPMTRSPPFLVSSSPGPDPYRSNDNVYEELGPGRDSDGESEPPLHSDDDFAEDELSLPGERSFNKAPNANNNNEATTLGVTTIYHERALVVSATPTNSNNGGANVPERNSLLSSSSSTHDASTATAASSSSSHNNNNNNTTTAVATASGSSTMRSAGGLLSGMLRHTTGRSKTHSTNTNGTARHVLKPPKTTSSNVDEFNTSTSTTVTAEAAADLAPLQQMYDNRSNLMSLAYVPQHQHQQQHSHHNHAHAPHFHSLHHLHHNGGGGGGGISNNNNVLSRIGPQFYNTLESEVERRNRINAQLSQPTATPPVATIFRERIHYPGSGRYPQPYYVTNSATGLMATSMRTRTNPRSMDRRNRVAAPVEHIEPAYGYAEPVFHENYHYESCATPPRLAANAAQQSPLVYPAAYIMPDYTTGGSYRTPPIVQHHQHCHASSTYQNAPQLYTSRGDSSFGSDSGYSHHTPASSIGRHDYDIALPMLTAPALAAAATPKAAANKLVSALNFSWNRRKGTPPTTTPPPPTTLNVSGSITSAASVATTQMPALPPCNKAGAASPNNNSGNSSSTATSSLENSSSTASTVNNNNGCSSTVAASQLLHA